MKIKKIRFKGIPLISIIWELNMSIRDFFGFIGLWFKRILNIFSMGICVFFSIAFFSDSYEKTVPLVLLIILFILLSLFNAFYYFIRSEHLRIILTDCFSAKNAR